MKKLEEKTDLERQMFSIFRSNWEEGQTTISLQINTYDIKNDLKELGFKFSPISKEWIGTFKDGISAKNVASKIVNLQ